MLFEIIEDIAYEVVDIVNEAKHDWYFAKKQMDQIQGPSLYKEDD